VKAGVLALALALAAVTVHLHSSSSSSSILLKSADRKIAAQYDSSLGRGVLDAERDFDALFVKLSQAQTHLNELTNKVLEGAEEAKKEPAAPGGATQLHAVHVEEALDKSIAQASTNVDLLAHALRNAEEKLNTRVSFIVGPGSPAGAKQAEKAGKNTEGPPVALAHKARASQLSQQVQRPSVAASGDKTGFTSHASERRHVQAAYQKFYSLKAAKQAKIAKEATQGWDVTPYKDCKGADCNIELYLDLKTPNVDYTARTGKHFLPSMDKLRKTVTERGRLALNYGKVVGVIPTGPKGEGQAIVDPRERTQHTISCGSAPVLSIRYRWSQDERQKVGVSFQGGSLRQASCEAHLWA